MKIGDNIICITNRGNNFIKSKKYKIFTINKCHNAILDGYKLKGENNYTNFSYSIFDKYFITEQKLRKIKLEKLNKLYIQ